MIDELLAARTLRIPAEVWRDTLADYARAGELPRAAVEDADAELARRLPALAAAYARHSPHAAPRPADAPPVPCAACEQVQVRPLMACRTGGGPLVYGRCAACGHGVRLVAAAADAEAAARARHAGAQYYRARTADGAGYDAYADEASYREAKGARLVERLRAGVRGELGTLLEVGSGYGYTRVAAERAGIRTAGVDVNADACAEAARRYGLTTFHGTLSEALASTAWAPAPGGFDVVLHQFVLEHVVDPARELGAARLALRPGGALALLVPNMAAAEVDVFGASYRSFRGDHLHLFTRASLDALFARAGFALRACESHCNVHLFRGLISESALIRLYATGRGPDLFVLGERLP